MFKIEGQLAIITGGANGIGKGICEVFCRSGAKVVLRIRNEYLNLFTL